jgi:hypothetical protein
MWHPAKVIDVRLWKWIGVAGVAGVAATGAVVVRNERQRRAYTPDDVRARLHERAAVIEQTQDNAVTEPANQGFVSRLIGKLRRGKHG